MQKEVRKKLRDKMKIKPNYNKVEYCLGNGFELFSASTVLAVCQDSCVFRTW